MSEQDKEMESVIAEVEREAIRKLIEWLGDQGVGERVLLPVLAYHASHVSAEKVTVSNGVDACPRCLRLVTSNHSCDSRPEPDGLSVAESWWDGQTAPIPWTKDGFKTAFVAGWKAASERKDAEINELRSERDEYERLANEWMVDHDRLKEKHEPLIAVPSASEIQSLQSKLATALEALEYYANRRSWDWESERTHDDSKLTNVRGDHSDIEYIENDGEKYTNSFGGKRAREALAKIKGEK